MERSRFTLSLLLTSLLVLFYDDKIILVVKASFVCKNSCPCTISSFPTCPFVSSSSLSSRSKSSEKSDNFLLTASSISPGGSKETSGDKGDVYSRLLSRFQGDFDNYNQVVEDRKDGFFPREGGGHEHIHCLLVPLSRENERLAAFYFDGMPQRIFRFRHYQILRHNTTQSGARDQDESIHAANNAAYMKLSTLHPDLEIKLSSASDPMEWSRMFDQFNSSNADADANNNNTDNHAFAGNSRDEFNKVKLLEGCDIRWAWDADPAQHLYAIEHQKKNKRSDFGIHAVMVYGEAIVDSTMAPGTKIRILDQLSLWEDEFWIHDRGFHPVTGDYIYGNQRDVPYLLQRVTDIKHFGISETNQNQNNIQHANTKDIDKSKQRQRRVVVNKNLQWTLGPQWRTQELYEENMSQIGDVTSQLNKQ